MSGDEFYLVALRHGHSEWNLTNRFTGWTDVPLTEIGLREAATAGRRLAAEGFTFDEAHISFLRRTRQTLDALLAAAKHSDIPIHATWRLNERHYGQLQGMIKQEIFACWGEELSRLWWRGYHQPPPLLDEEDPRHPRFDTLYCEIERTLLPASESLAQCRARLVPYWDEVIAPRVQAGQRLLLISHGNALRSLSMHVENISPEEIESVEIPSGVPLVYRFNASLEVIDKAWLD